MNQSHCNESSQRYSLIPQISDIVIKPLKTEKKNRYIVGTQAGLKLGRTVLCSTQQPA